MVVFAFRAVSVVIMENWHERFYIANMTLHFGYLEVGRYWYCDIYSYDTRILRIIETRNRLGDSREFDKGFYSKTTRKHQGLALAIGEFLIVNGFKETARMIEKWKIKTLKGLRDTFGYERVEDWENVLTGYRFKR